MTVNITSFNIELIPKRKNDQDSFILPFKKQKISSYQANPIEDKESNYSKYLNTVGQNPQSNDYKRFLMNRAVEEYCSGNLDKSVKTCHDILVIEPNSFFAKKLRGEVYYKQNKYEEAFRDLKQAFQAYPFLFEADPEFMIKESLKQNDDQTALILLRLYLNRFPDDIPFLLIRANLYLKKGILNLVSKDIVELDDKISEMTVDQQKQFFMISGELNLKLGKINDAKNYFKKVLDLDPFHLGALEKCLLIIFKSKNSSTKIYKYLDLIIKQYPHLKEWKDFEAAYNTWKKRSSESQTDQWQEIERICSQGLSKNPKNQCLLFLHGIVLHRLNRYDETEKVFVEIIKDYPRDSYSLNFLGGIELCKKNYELSLKYLNQCLQIDDTNKCAKETRALVYLYRKEYRLAQSDILELLNVGYVNANVLINYAHILIKQDKLESALEYLYFAFQLDPKNKNSQHFLMNLTSNFLAQHTQNYKANLKSLYYRSIIYLKNKRFSDALVNLDSIVKADPAYFPALYAKSVCLFKMGRVVESQNLFSSTLKSHIGFSDSSAISEEDIMMQSWRKKGVILRPFQIEDVGRFTQFYDDLHSRNPIIAEYSLEELNKMGNILGQRQRQEDYEIVTLQVTHSAKIKGCAYSKFYTHSKKATKICSIELIHVADKYQKKGFGSLLLNYSLHQAIKRGCHETTLQSTEEGRSLYFSYGFTPTNLESDELKKWEKLDMQGKIAYYANQTEAVSLSLDLKNPSVLKILEQKLQKNLDQPYKI